MSAARMSITPDDQGRYRVWCEPCDAEDTFPDIVMAVAARRHHLCDGEVPSAAWPGWDGVPDEADR